MKNVSSLEHVIECSDDIKGQSNDPHLLTSNQEQFQHYLNVTQAGTLRLDSQSTPMEVAGLCSQDFYQCIAIIISNENKTRISFTHTDLVFSEQAVIDECQWIGEPCNITLIQGAQYATYSSDETESLQSSYLPRLKNAISLQGMKCTIDLHLYNANAFAVSISRYGEISTFVTRVSDFGKQASHIDYRHAVNMMNLWGLIFFQKFGPQRHSFDIQFDGPE